MPRRVYSLLPIHIQLPTCWPLCPITTYRFGIDVLFGHLGTQILENPRASNASRFRRMFRIVRC